ncbi:thioredoxin family protein [Fimbriiglobus ruber]|uniref:Thiol reductase thioredoxin n=1 Tax=Fimbriiglobus ruber TaxID=1908690 RepID=A0A225E141_9BACT|nr:thioredoxin family protein [Fimbriiglobus ruber]OWK46903.1 hypothetical protein FRUB_00602 [Fimbriiglobus ruber]
MLAFDFFNQALPYEEFLSTYGSGGDRDRWDRSRTGIVLTAEQQKLLGTFTRKTNVLLLAGAWCGDCSAQCPVFERFREAAPVLNVRYLDRDAHPAAQAELQINGGNRVPVAVFFSEDGYEVARYGERTLAAYRRLVRNVIPDISAPGAADYPAEMVADWLREVERVQWVLRLSSRLRRLHQD